jgi:hypothetical protein
MENTNKKIERNYPQAIQDCIKDADLVISGNVSNIRKVEYDENHPISKHDPKWNEATIRIENIEKGSHVGNEIKVLFPQSDHISWCNSKKLDVGHESTYILHKESIPQLNGKEAYTVLHETDVHSKDDVDQIKSLIKESES